MRTRGASLRPSGPGSFTRCSPACPATRLPAVQPHPAPLLGRLARSRNQRLRSLRPAAARRDPPVSTSQARRRTCVPSAPPASRPRQGTSNPSRIDAVRPYPIQTGVRTAGATRPGRARPGPTRCARPEWLQAEPAPGLPHVGTDPRGEPGPSARRSASRRWQDRPVTLVGGLGSCTRRIGRGPRAPPDHRWPRHKPYPGDGEQQVSTPRFALQTPYSHSRPQIRSVAPMSANAIVPAQRGCEPIHSHYSHYSQEKYIYRGGLEVCKRSSRHHVSMGLMHTASLSIGGVFF